MFKTKYRKPNLNNNCAVKQYDTSNNVDDVCDNAYEKKLSIILKLICILL